MQMFSSVIRKKSENRNKNLLNTMQHFIIISTCINDQIFPPLKKNPANTLIILYILYKKGETTQGEYVTGPKPPGERIP